MRKVIALSLLATGLVLAGCSKPSMVGKWTVTGQKGAPPGATVTTEFKDSTFDTLVTVSQMGMTLNITGKGTYTFDGKVLSMTTTEMSMDEASLPAAAKPYLPMIKSEFEKAKGKVSTGEVKLEGDTATWTVDGNAVTMTKAK